MKPDRETENIQLYLGDCLEIMPTLPEKSVDLILADLPFGTTACKWDFIIPLEQLWMKYKQIIKDYKAIVLFCQEPFSSILVCSNLEQFKYMWYWQKSRPSGHVNAKLKPLKDIVDIAIFSSGTTANGCEKTNMPYFPQGTVPIAERWERPKSYMNDSGVSPQRKNSHKPRIRRTKNYPRQVLSFGVVHNVGLLHPTQKPVPLLEYLIQTYTNEGETVLDNVMGSGSTGVACVNTNRNFIGMELDEHYFQVAQERIENHKPQLKLF